MPSLLSNLAPFLSSPAASEAAGAGASGIGRGRRTPRKVVKFDPSAAAAATAAVTGKAIPPGRRGGKHSPFSPRSRSLGNESPGRAANYSTSHPGASSRSSAVRSWYAPQGSLEAGLDADGLDDDEADDDALLLPLLDTADAAFAPEEPAAFAVAAPAAAAGLAPPAAPLSPPSRAAALLVPNRPWWWRNGSGRGSFESAASPGGSGVGGAAQPGCLVLPPGRAPQPAPGGAARGIPGNGGQGGRGGYGGYGLDGPGSGGMVAGRAAPFPRGGSLPVGTAGSFPPFLVGKGPSGNGGACIGGLSPRGNGNGGSNGFFHPGGSPGGGDVVMARSRGHASSLASAARYANTSSAAGGSGSSARAQPESAGPRLLAAAAVQPAPSRSGPRAAAAFDEGGDNFGLADVFGVDGLAHGPWL
jgi:hypothetical protein